MILSRDLPLGTGSFQRILGTFKGSKIRVEDDGFLEKAALAVGEGDDGFVGIWPVQLPRIDLGLVRLCEGDIHIGHIG